MLDPPGVDEKPPRDAIEDGEAEFGPAAELAGFELLLENCVEGFGG